MRDSLPSCPPSAWCGVARVFPPQNLASVLNSVVTHEGRVLARPRMRAGPTGRCSPQPILSGLGIKMVLQALSRVQGSLLAFLLYRKSHPLQPRGWCYLRENLLQTMRNERELGIKTFPVMLLYSISSSS